MILDELIARLGFKVEGLDKVKAATKAMNPLQRDLQATASKTAIAAAAASRFRGALAGLALMLRRAGSALKAMLMSLVAFIGRSTAVAGGLGLIAAAALKMAVNFAKARGEAAQLRKEANALAGAQRTTTGTQNAFEGAIQLQGFSADFAKKVREGLFEKLYEAADQAIRGEGDGKETLSKLGIKSAMDAEGNQRDTGALALQGMAELLKRQSEATKLRAKVNALPPGSKEREKAKGPANKAEIALRNDLDKLKLGQEFDSLIRNLGQAGVTVDQFIEALNKAASMNPGQNEEQRKRSDEIASAWSRIELASKGLQAAFDELKNFIVSKFIGPVADAMEGLVSLGKRLGIINKTKAEIDAESEATRENNRNQGRMRVSEQNQSAEDVRKGKLQTEIRLLEDRINQAKSRPDTVKNRMNVDQMQQMLQSLQQTLKSLDSGLSSFGQRLNEIQTDVSPGKNVDGMMRDKKTEAIKNEDNRQYSDIGNDQRTITNSVTVNATGLEGVANAVKNALNSSNLIKATTASTGAITQS